MLAIVHVFHESVFALSDMVVIATVLKVILRLQPYRVLVM